MPSLVNETPPRRRPRVIGLIVLWVSYSSNRGYLDEVGNDVATLRRVRPPAARSSLEAFLPYLNAVRAVSDSACEWRRSTLGTIPSNVV